MAKQVKTIVHGLMVRKVTDYQGSNPLQTLVPKVLHKPLHRATEPCPLLCHGILPMSPLHHNDVITISMHDMRHSPKCSRNTLCFYLHLIMLCLVYFSFFFCSLVFFFNRTKTSSHISRERNDCFPDLQI